MKHAKRTAKILGRVILTILILSLTLTGCGQEDTGVESGFYDYKEYLLTDRDLGLVAYRSDKSVFDINDVTLEFFYGVREEYQRYSFGKGKAGFYSGGLKPHVWYTEEKLSSDKYNVSETLHEEDEGLTKIIYTFNHSEKLTVPKELFYQESGYITFSIFAQSEDPVEYELGITVHCGTMFYYDVIENGTKVKIRKAPEVWELD